MDNYVILATKVIFFLEKSKRLVMSAVDKSFPIHPIENRTEKHFFLHIIVAEYFFHKYLTLPFWVWVSSMS